MVVRVRERVQEGKETEDDFKQSTSRGFVECKEVKGMEQKGGGMWRVNLARAEVNGSRRDGRRLKEFVEGKGELQKS